MLSLFISTPTNVILHLTGEMPLKIRRRFITDRRIIKWINSAQNNLILSELIDRPGLERAISILASESYLVLLSLRTAYGDMFAENGSMRFCDIPYFSYFEDLNVSTRSCVCIRKCVDDSGGIDPPNNEATLNYILRENGLGDATPFYTDGSRIPDGGVECGIFSREKGINIKFSLSEFLSIYDAEAIAILHALRCILHADVRNSIIISDSLSVLSALRSPAVPGRLHGLIVAIRQIVSALSADGFSVHFLWIPGHSGIYGNDAADSLAKDGASGTDVSSMHSLFCFPESLFPELRRKAVESSLEMLREEAIHKGYRYFNCARSRDLSPWFCDHLDLPRSTVVLISRMRSFHVNLPYHLHDKNFTDSLLCECGAIGTIQLRIL